jgi:hypothetical protein
MPENTGNISYSLNKDKFYAILSTANGLFLPYYYGLIFLLYIYLITIRFKKYFFSDRNAGLQENKNTIHFYKSLTYNSPFKIMNLREETKKNDDEGGIDKYTGLTTSSYLYLIIGYVIAFMIILQAYIRNYIYSIYTSVIQVNSNNNPYKNTNCITKTKKNAFLEAGKNYTAIMMTCGMFIMPFFIPFFIWLFDFDNYDIKHSSWFPYLILYFLFFPFINVILTRTVFSSTFSIIPDIKKYTDFKDVSFVDFILNNYNSRIYSIILFIFIIIVYCLYTVMIADFKYVLKWRCLVYFLIFIVIGVFIPIFIIFFVQSIIFSNKLDGIKGNNKNSTSEIVNNINKNGVSSLYELLVKYNYPCFKK